MLNYLMERAKMFASAFGLALGQAFITSFEKTFTFDIPAAYETYIIGFTVMMLTFWVPNKTTPAPVGLLSAQSAGWGANFKDIWAMIIAAISMFLAKFLGIGALLGGGGT